MLCISCNKNSYSEKMTHFFGKKTTSELNQMLPEKDNQIKLDFLPFFPRMISYLESNLNFTIEICLCLKTTFPEKERLNLQWHPVCFHLRHRQPLWWIYRCKGPDWQTTGLPKEAYRQKNEWTFLESWKQIPTNLKACCCS